MNSVSNRAKQNFAARAVAFVCATVLALISDAAASGAQDPYLVLRNAYAKRDATAAASAYAPNAVYSERFAGAKPVVRTGRAAIQKGFDSIFAQFGPAADGAVLDLNFRFENRAPDEGGVDKGVYRLAARFGVETEAYYGRFAVRRHGGFFTDDTSSDATRDDFERLAGPVAYDAETEALDSAYYNQFLGRYRDASGCDVLITRSMRRLFALDGCSNAWRALSRVDGGTWTAGTAVWSDAKESTLRWEGGVLRIENKDSIRIAQPVHRTTRESVRVSTAGAELGAVIYRPKMHGRKAPGVVLIHGSGPQDRHGYASLMDLLATRLAEKGAVVLSYDKRGVGSSTGDWSRAGFDVLSSDAVAAMQFLRKADGVDATRVGLAGSSQAGWVAAKASTEEGAPDFVLLIGAAGAAMTVEEQNLYNTDVRMRCAGFDSRERRLALEQQRAFFAAKRDPRGGAARLVAATERANKAPRIAEWLFPGTVQSEPTGEWFDVLDPDFDPAPLWRSYAGRKYFLFGELDDSTPTALAVRRLKRLQNAVIAVLPGAQHIGLAASDICRSDLEFVDGFHEGFARTLDSWADEIIGGLP